MKKYDVHVILDSKFHSVVIECAGFRVIKGVYIFYRDKQMLPGAHSQSEAIEEFAWYPANRTVIEEHKENKIPTGSGQWRN